MPKAVIFDVDGTLVNSVDLHARAWQDAFRDFGHDIPFTEIRNQIGKGGDQLMPVFLNKEELDTIGKKLEEHRSALFKERYLDAVKPFPRVRELFQRLRGDGVRIVLASSAKADELHAYEKIARIDDLLDAETSSDDAEKSKPHPDVFEAAMSRLPGIDRADVLVVGDLPYDAEAARKAGLRTLGVLSGGFPESALREAGCSAIYRDPADLLANYDRSPIAGARQTPSGGPQHAATAARS